MRGIEGQIFIFDIFPPNAIKLRSGLGSAIQRMFERKISRADILSMLAEGEIIAGGALGSIGVKSGALGSPIERPSSREKSIPFKKNTVFLRG
ncbi:MAG: DUF4258 domain-containing protein [Proteobacteria bacterium]|nr:DUF4258 domain-containing protein [Pseudomonadota bacterium]